VLPALKDFALNDSEPKIQKKALFSLSQIESKESQEFLLEVAKNHKNSEMREEAIFWMGQSADNPNVFEELKNFALNDKDPKVQQKAIFAISQLEDNQGVPFLINIAKNHSNLKLRKKAIFWLGQTDDERASKALEDILYNK